MDLPSFEFGTVHFKFQGISMSKYMYENKINLPTVQSLVEPG
jgi:hypothetical protein